MSEEQIKVGDWDVTIVKAENAFLRATDYKENQTLRNIVILGLISHDAAEERVKADGTKSKFNESWQLKVEYAKQQYTLRLYAKNIVALRDELKFGTDMTKWIGKTFDLITKKYSTGLGFVVAI